MTMVVISRQRVKSDPYTQQADYMYFLSVLDKRSRRYHDVDPTLLLLNTLPANHDNSRF